MAENVTIDRDLARRVNNAGRVEATAAGDRILVQRFTDQGAPDLRLASLDAIGSGATIPADALGVGSSARSTVDTLSGVALLNQPEANVFHVCAYAGSTLNAKWTAAVAAMDTQRPKIVVVRRPFANETGARNVSGRGWMWDLTAPLVFDDQLSLAHVYLYGGFTCDPSGDAVASALLFSQTDKTEDINIYTQVSIYGADKMSAGIQINGGARIAFLGGSRVTYCNGPGVYMAGLHAEATNDTFLGDVVSAGNRGPAVRVNGEDSQIRATKLRSAQEQGTPQTGGTAAHVLEITGIIRGFDCGEVKLQAATGSIGAPSGSIVYIGATASGGIPQFGMNIETIHQDGHNNTALEISKGDYAGSTKITGVRLGRSISSSGGTEVALAWCDEVDLNGIRYGDITIDAATCGVVRVRNSDKAEITITWPTDGSEILELWQDGTYTCTKTTSSSALNRARCFSIPVPAKFETSCILDILCSGTNGESLYSGTFRARPTLTGSLAQSTIQTGANCAAHSARADLSGAVGVDTNITWSIAGSAGAMRLYLENRTGNSRTLTATLR